MAERPCASTGQARRSRKSGLCHVRPYRHSQPASSRQPSLYLLPLKRGALGQMPSPASPGSSSSQPTPHPGASQHSCDPVSVQPGRGLGEGRQRERARTPGHWTHSSSRDRMRCSPSAASKGNARQRQSRIPASCLLLAASSCRAGASPGDCPGSTLTGWICLLNSHSLGLRKILQQLFSPANAIESGNCTFFYLF